MSAGRAGSLPLLRNPFQEGSSSRVTSKPRSTSRRQTGMRERSASTARRGNTSKSFASSSVRETIFRSKKKPFENGLLCGIEEDRRKETASRNRRQEIPRMMTKKEEDRFTFDQGWPAVLVKGGGGGRHEGLRK